MTSLEKRLYKSAEGYKNLPSCSKQVYAEALATGVTPEVAAAVTNKVLQALQKTEHAELGSKYGRAHDPMSQYRHLAMVMRQFRSQ